MLESSDGSTRHGPLHKKESNAKPSQGTANHMLPPFSSDELKRSQIMGVDKLIDRLI